ncbi:hypothetical protein ACFLSG_05040, partial [Candidatus Bipolaricaulota bacterium]
AHQPSFKVGIQRLPLCTRTARNLTRAVRQRTRTLRVRQKKRGPMLLSLVGSAKDAIARWRIGSMAPSLIG